MEKKFETVFNAKCVSSSYFSGATTFFTFLTGQKMWKFICVKSDFLLHWIVSANFTSKYTLKTFISSFKLVSSICHHSVWRYFVFWCWFGRTTFLHKYCKKTNKSDYKCDIRVSILLKFAFNISRKVREIIFEPKMCNIGSVLTR